MSNRAESSRLRAGFSLLEAIAAVVIVGTTAIGALSASGSDLRTAARAQRALEAEALATSRLDFMNLLYDADLQALPDTVAKGRFDKPLDAFSWTATSTPYSDQAGIYDVRVTVTWADGSYTERTYLYRRPVVATRR